MLTYLQSKAKPKQLITARARSVNPKAIYVSLKLSRKMKDLEQG